mgnify:CR=1 FL=1
MAFHKSEYGIDARRLLIRLITLELAGEVRREGGKEREKCKLTVPEGRKSP